jgi:hypothetical protein
MSEIEAPLYNQGSEWLMMAINAIVKGLGGRSSSSNTGYSPLSSPWLDFGLVDAMLQSERSSASA